MPVGVRKQPPNNNITRVKRSETGVIPIKRIS
jgi:hypothetical protein